MADFETRPLNVYHSSNWQTMNGRSSEPGPSYGRAGRASLITSSLNGRRRSSAASAPPAGPPPTIPIPNLPSLTENTFTDYEEDEYSSAQESDNISALHSHSDPPVFDLNPFQRHVASSQLTAVAQFSQARLAAAGPVSPHSADPRNSPPRAALPRPPPTQPPPPPPSHPPPQPPSQEGPSDRLLLSPGSRDNSTSTRPSSRRALTRALELAREAVRLDSTNDDPHGAIKAYGESVRLLNEVMERVMRGEDTDRRRNGRRRSIVAQEEEVRRLRSIHDTYADRMNILSLIYSIPTDNQPPLHSGHSRPASPSSETSRDSQPTVVNETVELDHDALFSDRSRDSSHQSLASDDLQPRVPSALSQNGTSEGVNGTQIADPASNRSLPSQPSKPVQSVLRQRSSSNLPPRPPYPSTSPPSTSSTSESRVGIPAGPPSPRLNVPIGDGKRSRGNSVSHRRVGSGSRLETLKEEAGVVVQRSPYDSDTDRNRSGTNGRCTDSPPLPELPSPSKSGHAAYAASDTPRGSVIAATGSHQNQAATDDRKTSSSVRPRNGSSLSDSTGNRMVQRLINDTPAMGSILQRREKNKSNASAIPDGLVDEVNGSSSRLPSNNPSAVSGGRDRALSYPVRPSIPISGLPAESGPRHPFQTSGQNIAVQQPRKSSLQQGPHLISNLHNNLYPPSSFNNHGLTLTLVPPPPVLPEVPTTPSSPLPPMPPNDTLRRPYHLMKLLGDTMTSRSGGYITRKLHVPYDVWSQGGAKLTNLPEKIRVVEVLCDALTELQNASVEFAGPMSVASGMGMGVGSITRKDGEVWAMKLEEFSVVCDNVVSNFGKKLGVGEGFIVKKSSGVGSWGGKLSRRIDKLTNGKNLDSPVHYVQGLARLFNLTQLLDEHTMALNSQPLAPVYAALPVDIRSSLESALKRSSDFFATVVLTFVIRDLSQLLDKYAKKGEKWLAE